MDNDLQEYLNELQELIKKVKEYYKKYKENENEKQLTEIASIYKENIIPLNDKIRKKKYKNMELIQQEDGDKYLSILKYNTHLPEDVEEFFDIEDEYRSSSLKEEEKPIKKEKSIIEEKPLIQDKPKEKLVIEDDKIIFEDNIIINKNDFEKNKELLKNMIELDASKAYKNNYKFEMIYTGKEKPVLIGIDPDFGELYKINAGR